MISRVLILILFSIRLMALDSGQSARHFNKSDSEKIKQICKLKSKIICELKKDEFFKLQKELCEIDFTKNDCTNKIKKNLDESWKYKKCDEVSLCLQNEHDELDSFSTCLIGGAEMPRILGEAALGAADAIISIPENIKNYLSSVSNNVNERNDQLKKCSLECKRKYALLNPTTKYLADPKNETELKKISAVYLWSKKIEYDPIRVKLMMNGGITKEQYYKEMGFKPKEISLIQNLSFEESISLSSMWASVKSYVETQYTDVMCYTPLEKIRLMCGVFVDVVSGTVAEKALANRTAKLVSKSIKQQERNPGQSLARRLADTSLTKSELVSNYAQKNVTSTVENQSWLDFIRKPRKNPKNVTIENSVLKKLNDKIFKDEEFVTALTNLAKEIQIEKFKKLESQLQKQFPDFKFEYFSDYKGVRVAYDELPGMNLDKQIEKIINDSNNEFVQLLLEKNIVRATDEPASWFKASIGQSDDMSNLAARFARGNTDSMFVNATDNPAFKKWVDKEFKDGKSLHSEIMKNFNETKVIVESNGEKFLHRDVLEILRKNKDDKVAAKSLIEQKFGLQPLSDTNFSKLTDYFEKVDNFSPGLRGVKREFATLSDSNYGGLSIDMIGLGADHLQQTSARAFGTANNLEDFLVKARAGEEAVTAEVASRKQKIEEAVKRITGEPQAHVSCSGDGCKAYLSNRELTQQEVQQISDDLTLNAGESGKLRFSQVSKLQKKADADFIAKKGEDIEKAIRTRAGREIELRRLEGVNFTVQISASNAGSDGVAHVHISTAKGLILSKEDNLKLQKIINDAVKASGYKPK